MNAGILPICLLFVAAGLTLSFASFRDALLAAAALIVAALIIASLNFPPSALEPVLVGLWASCIATVALMHLARRLGTGWAIATGLNAGGWAGALAALSSLRPPMLYSFPILLLALPGQWLVGRGYGIAVKVVGSWVVAVATLAIFVSLTPTPGYKPDHMQ
ncbi:MAG: hypothetical protein ABIW33_05015 [Sphingomicrobium sp.]